MSAIPFLIIILLLCGSSLAVILPRRRTAPALAGAGPTTECVIAASVALGSLLLWLPVRSSLPLTVTLSRWPAAAQLPPLTWQINAIGWTLSAAVLLLGAAILMINLWPPGSTVAASTLCLVGATLLAIWAGSLPDLLWAWMLLVILWGVVVRAERGGAGSLRLRAGALALSLLLLWLAAVASPPAGVADSSPLDWGVTGRPAAAATWLLLAAIWLAGIFPLSFWRPWNVALPRLREALIQLMPAVAGVGLLLQLAVESDVTMRYSLPLTGFGLLGLLVGTHRAWSHIGDTGRMAAGLLLAEGGMLLLVVTWSGETGAAAALAEARVWILAGGLLFLVPHLPASGRPLWLFRAGPVLGLAALAGLPLTAGFVGRSALYNAWLSEGRFILILVSVLLNIPFIAATFWLVWGIFRQTGGQSPAPLAWPSLAAGIGLLLPALGLFASPGNWGNVAPLSWLAVLMAPLGAALMLYFLDEIREVPGVLAQLIPGTEGWQMHLAWLPRTAAHIGGALRQASLILEGEGGVLWLLLLALLVWLATG